ncbi:beta-glucosidase-like glycosyl hydrolase [Chitinophaga skermanii]|uniref:beta-N-acetylhexosaminidase n=1 Tax=Chitinophaga skermanii TaxID=331697 RepID=A0A327Q2W5_9BACT|nr:glycoside hydrolase family 3 N-terminal domain-containing protein [Chitinophaga skermanii]RAI98750.1 beta-glucosidase-like glycosyl hydrolase [Chitinophaga skermanii]
MMKYLLVIGFAGILFSSAANHVSAPPSRKGQGDPQKKQLTQKKQQQQKKVDPAQRWADSVFNTLTPDERIAQLIMIRVHSNLGQDHVNAVIKDIKENKVGGMVTFQGGPGRQANLVNYYQSISKVPMLVAVDGEWGLGMRLDSVISFPRNLMLGAIQDSTLIYEIGKAIGKQCIRQGIQYNFAPVVDVNNNPQNPVINDRSFGEDKYQVARLGVAMVKGMQDQGIMACAKHFPGHGDTDVDSHAELPTISKSLAELDSLELYPFQRVIDAGVASVMIAHLNVPAIDPSSKKPTSISYETVTNLLQKKMGFDGIIVTDALEMKGISNYYKNGNESLMSLLAGNDLMELPSTSKGSIEAIKEAIKKGVISREEVNRRVKKVLIAKYKVGLANWKPIDPNNIVNDLNQDVMPLRQRISEEAITLLKNDNRLIPFSATTTNRKTAVIAVGADGTNTFVQAVKGINPNVDSYIFTSNQGESQIPAIVQRLKNNYQNIIISVHNYSRRPARNYGLSNAQRMLVNQLQHEMPAAVVMFGNPYAMRYFCDANTMVAAYEDDSTTHRVAAEIIFGRLRAKGKLPVTVCENYHFGDGIVSAEITPAHLATVTPESVGMNSKILARIDSLAGDMMAKGAAPGCQVLAMKDGKIVYNKSLGYYDYSRTERVTSDAIYDLASVTKVCATTVSIMRLYDEGKINLDGTLGDYLPWVRGSNKAGLKIRDILLHQAGLVAYIPFYKDVLMANGYPDTALFRQEQDSAHTLRVAENMYMVPSYVDTMYKKILDSKLGPSNNYVYSDNDFIFLGKIVEQLSGKTLDRYAKDNFYTPLGMYTTGFQPRERFGVEQLVPTEREHTFRIQWIRGDVHDPGAAMFGGVSGHAGLFSNAHDLAIMMQMLLNGGNFNSVKYIKPSTIELFNQYQSKVSRRGYGFDKPEKDNASRKEPYPCKSASPQTFGHTGFTGTCVWVDPKYNLVFIFLSNRVCPNGENNRLLQLNVRGKMMQTLYDAMGI